MAGGRTKRGVDVILKGRDQASPVMRGAQKQAQQMSKTGMGAAVAIGTAFANVAMAGLRKFQAGLSENIRLFGVQEKAEVGLRNALTLLNKEHQSEEMYRFASELQSLTTVGDEVTIQLMQMGAAMAKLEGDQLKGATVAAIGLAKAYGIDTVAAMRLVARARVGDTASLARYGIKLDASLDAQGKFNELLKIGAHNFRLAMGEAQSTTGRLEQTRNMLGDLREELGEALAPVLIVIMKLIIQAAPLIQKTISGISIAIKFMVAHTVASFTLMEFIVKNWRRVFNLAVKAAALGIYRFVEDLKWQLGVNAPKLLQWFARNWRNIFTDLFNYTRTVFTNLIGNIVRIVSMLPQIIKGSVDWKSLWLPLEMGFKKTMEDLPEFTARPIGALERAMMEEVGQTATGLVDEVKAKIQERLGALFDEGGGALPEFEVPGLDGLNVKLDGMGAESKRGLAAMESRFLKRAPGQDPIRKTADSTKDTANNTKTMVNEQKETNDLLQRLIDSGATLYMVGA